LTRILWSSSSRDQVRASDRTAALEADSNDRPGLPVPLGAVRPWAFTDQISIEGEQPLDSQTSSRILIEKDFACIDGTDEENADTFPNPLVEERKLPDGLPERRFP
jgi:hypothetical protein